MERFLFLTSTGLPPEIRRAFLDKLPKKPEETTVAFIPTAADPESDKSFVKAALDELAELKFPIVQVGLKDTTGLNLVPFVVSPHYEEKENLSSLEISCNLGDGKN